MAISSLSFCLPELHSFVLKIFLLSIKFCVERFFYHYFKVVSWLWRRVKKLLFLILLGCIVSNEKTDEIIIFVPLYVMYSFLFFSVCFSGFFCSHWVSCWTIMCIGCFKEWILLEVLWDSWVCGFFFFK